MLGFTLNIFPFDSTAITVTTTVWVGVVVSVFFNLRLGWTLSGLVVPGFVVPLIVTRPITASVILLESAITYWIVYLLSEGPRKTPYWSSFFGRDRFFVIFLVSVVVRAFMDAYFLPWVGQMMVEDYGINFDYRNNLHSFGLILVALIANYFWKPGLMRGLPPLVTCIAITYVIIQGILVNYTNFNVGNFHLLYEDVTESMMASPKAYIIVLTTAYIASWMNLRYAWDFNGILIPALLGLLWHEPTKIVVSCLECFLLLGLGKLVMTTPVMRKIAIEGSRKTLYYFSICFIYRLLACHFVPILIPSIKMTDTFGAGYLLTTLMAIKIHDKKKPISMLLGTAKVSMVGAVAGSIFGFVLVCGPRIQLGFATPVVGHNVAPLAGIDWVDRSISSVAREDKTLLYEKRKADSYQPPLPGELTEFRSAIELIQAMGSKLTDEKLNAIAAKLRAINYKLSVVEDRYLYLRERSPANGWGMYVIDTQQTDGLCVQVPAPLDEWSTLESGLSLLKHVPSSSLAIAGTSRHVNFTGNADVMNAMTTMFAVFHDLYNKNGVLQVRGYTRSIYRKICKYESVNYESDAMRAAQSRMYVRGQVPPQIRLSDLKRLSGSLDVRWRNSPLANKLRDTSSVNFAELLLNRIDRRRLVAQVALENGDNEHSNKPIISQTCLRDWLGGEKDRVLQQGSEGYVPANLEQILYMDEEVVTPLVACLENIKRSGSGADLTWLDDQVSNDLQVINGSAMAQGYQLTVIQDTEAEDCFIALSEVPTNANKGWGIFVFRVGLSDPFAVEIPRPLYERRSFDFGASLFERPRGSALMIAGAHPKANADGSADISKSANKTNLFNLVRHILLRRLGDRPFLITQARAIQAPVQADIVVATDDGATAAESLGPLKTQLLNQLKEDQLTVKFVDGEEETAGYELGILMQATSVQVSQNKEVVSLWLSPSLRNKYREQADNHGLTAQFDACGISTINEKLTSYLSQFVSEGDACWGDRMSAKMTADVLHYATTFDIVRLHQLKQSNPDWTLQRLVDPTTGQAFLLLNRDKQHFPAVINLTGAIGKRTVQIDTFDLQEVRRYVRSRSLWLTPRQNTPVNSLRLEKTK